MKTGKARLAAAAAMTFALAAGVVTAGCQPKAAKQEPAVGEVLASYPGPTFLENLYVAPDGAVFFTNYTGRSVELVRPGQPVQTFAQLDSHPVSLLPRGEGFLLAVHGAPFTDPAALAGSGRILMLDKDGIVTDAVDAPDAGFLNGMAMLPDGSVLIADSVKAQILRFDPEAGTLTPWFSDPQLAPAVEPRFLPGVNGLKLVGGVLWLSSSARKALFRLPLTPDGQPAGALEIIAENLPGADDFAPLPEGGFLIATHADRVVKISATGAVETFSNDPRVLGSTAVALSGTGPARRAIILGTGGFSEGGTAEAVVLAAPAPAS